MPTGDADKQEEHRLGPRTGVEAAAEHDPDPGAAAKPGLNAFGRRFMRIFCKAIEAGAKQGLTRGQMASALGVSPHTMESWLKPSRTSLIPVDRFFELACREDVLPRGPRDELWADMGVEGGYVVVPQLNIDSDAARPLLHLAQIAVSFGKLAEQVRVALSEDGPEGETVAPSEAKTMLEPLRELEREVVELRLGLEELIRRAAAAEKDRNLGGER